MSSDITSQHLNLVALEKPSALGDLLFYLLSSFGNLNHSQLIQLSECFASHGVIGFSEVTQANISNTLQDLMLTQHKVLYSAKNGLWRVLDVEDRDQEKPTPKLSIKSNLFSTQNIPTTGIGSEYIYMLYQTESRIQSIISGIPNWLMKIGRTNNIERRLSELTLAGPNSYVIGSAFKTDNAIQLEKFIHTELRERQKTCFLPGRKEWFYSNIGEIKEIRNCFQEKLSKVA